MHSYLPQLVRRGGVVIDFGANRGEFARAMVEEFGSVVHAVEPNPVFRPVLEGIEGIRLHMVCLAPTSGLVQLAVPNGADATLLPPRDSNVPRLTVAGVTLETFFAETGLHEVELLKMDVEGAELVALEKAPAEILCQARQITVEFHDWMIPTTTKRVEAVKRRLRQLGYYHIRFSRNNGDVLFVREDLVSPAQYAWTAFVVRNAMGARRVCERWIRKLAGVVTDG